MTLKLSHRCRELLHSSGSREQRPTLGATGRISLRHLRAVSSQRLVGNHLPAVRTSEDIPANEKIYLATTAAGVQPSSLWAKLADIAGYPSAEAPIRPATRYSPTDFDSTHSDTAS